MFVKSGKKVLASSIQHHKTN